MISKKQLLILIFITLLLPLLTMAQGGPIKSKRFTGFSESNNPSYSYSYELKYQLQSTNYGNRPTAIKVGISNFTIIDFKYNGQNASDVLGTSIFGNCRAQADVSGHFYLQYSTNMLKINFREEAVSNGGLDIYYFTSDDVSNIKSKYGEDITYDDLDISVMSPELSNLAVGKIAEIQNAMDKAKQANFQKKLEAEMAKEKQRVKDDLKIQEQLAKNDAEEKEREEKDAEEQRKIDEMLSNPSNYTSSYSYSGSSNSTYSSQRASLQRNYENLLKRQEQERKSAEAMGEVIGNVVINITNAIIEDSQRREAQRQADAERRAIIQKQTNLSLKEELESHNSFMNERIAVLKSNTASLSKMLTTIKAEKLKEVFVVLVNYNEETKRPKQATIELPYKHLHISYFAEPVKMPVTEIYAPKYKKYIDNFNLFYVESLDVGKPVKRQSYYFKSSGEATNFITILENLKNSREEFVTWTTITTENYNPLNFQLQTGKNIQKDNPYQDIEITEDYSSYDASTEIDKEDITTNKSVIDRYMKVVGGQDKLKEIETAFFKSKLTTQGVTLDVEIKIMSPSYYSQTLFFNGIEAMKEVSDGKKGYQVQAGVKSDLTNARAKEISKITMIPEPKSDKIDGKAKKRKVDGIATYLVIYKGDKEYYAVDTGLLIKKVTNINGVQDDDSDTVLYFSDYKNVNGVLLPFKQTTTLQGQSLVFEHQLVKFNEGVKKSDFKM